MIIRDFGLFARLFNTSWPLFVTHCRIVSFQGLTLIVFVFSDNLSAENLNFSADFYIQLIQFFGYMAIEWYWLVLFGFRWYCMDLHCIEWHSIILYDWMKAKNFHLMFIATTSFVFPLFRHKQDRVKLSKQVRHSVSKPKRKRTSWLG